MASETLLGQRACTVWLTGLSGAGKSTLAQALAAALADRHYLCTVLDGDALRATVCRDLGFSAQDRAENVRRAAHIAALLNDTGVLVVAAFVSPYARDRALAAEVIGPARFAEVFVDAPLSVCAQRDPKGHYRRVQAGELRDFTGVDAPYEAPLRPALHLRTAQTALPQCVDFLLDHLARRGCLLGGVPRAQELFASRT